MTGSLPHRNFELFDSHLHIIDRRFPLQSNKGYVPGPFSCEDYLGRLTDYNLVGGAVVSGSFQGFDQSYLLAALETLGSRFVGVTQLPASVSDEELIQLDARGVRAIRFNIRRGGSESLEYLSSMAHRVFELVGWHVELYVDCQELATLFDLLNTLPAVSIDHLGLCTDGFPQLLKLAEGGAHVKATGFGRVDLDVPQALRDLYAANPSCLMFGTDLPSTRAARPYSDSDFKLVIDVLGEIGARRVVHDNAVQFYRSGIRAGKQAHQKAGNG